MSDNQPAYNLKVVVRETGLKPDTIRAWERRYGLPQPDRTEGGHRLYSQRDIDILKWLISRQHEGLSISRAVDLWNSLETEGQDSLGKIPGYMTGGDSHLAEGEGSDRLGEFRRQWVQASMQFDELRAESLIAEALTLFSPEVVGTELLQRGIAEIGEQWYDDVATVQQEHFATGLAMRRIDALIAATAPPSRAGRILVGCPPGEDHVFGPLMLTFLLRRQGWDVVYLGANVPIERLDETIDQTRPDLVILSAQQISTSGSLLEAALHVESLGIPLAFGGRLFVHLPELISHIPGHYLGDDIKTAASTVHTLIVNPPELDETAPRPARYQQALDAFIANRGAISSDVYSVFSTNGVNPQHIEEANLRLGMTLVAALTLGDLSILEYDIAWINGLLSHRGIGPLDMLPHYLRGYSQIVANHLGKAGQIIVDELERLAELLESPDFIPEDAN